MAEEGRPETQAAVEIRDAVVSGVNFPQRIIEVVAVPYDQEALVEYRGEMWRESFERGAFAGVEKRPNRVKANRDHDLTRIVGKAVSWDTGRDDGLTGAIRIAPTPRGDETLTLADEDMLGVSVGFAVRGSDQVLDRAEHRRRIKRAFLDHLSFVAQGAYEGARVLAVREAPAPAEGLPPLDTPRLDEVMAWLSSRGKV